MLHYYVIYYLYVAGYRHLMNADELAATGGIDGTL